MNYEQFENTIEALNKTCFSCEETKEGREWIIREQDLRKLLVKHISVEGISDFIFKIEK